MTTLRINGFPDHIANVPEDRVGWLRWREDVLAFRELCHRLAEEDHEKRAGILALAASDPAFFMAVFGVIHEPRGTTDFRLDEHGNVVEMYRPRGWYPWIPYPFQVKFLRWIQEVLSTQSDESGKGDGAVEKSRDMGATWLFCAFAAWQWLFDDDVFVGFYSHKEALVDSSNPSSMFFKLRALLGINRKVPELCHAPDTIFDGHRVRLPDWMFPVGFESKEHDLKLNLKHPTKTNQIFGEATTSKSGIGSRTTWNLIDEGAKIDNVLDIWSGMSAVTDHRFINSSADRREGDGMYILVEQARAAQRDPSLEGPRLLSLPWHLHPLRDQGWYNRMKARHGADPSGFAREYDIDWNAGQGDFVYPMARQIVPEPVEWDPLAGEVTCTIDPGLRDATAVEWFQFLPGTGGMYSCFEALVLKTPSAAYLAPILMGFPPGHEIRNNYPDTSIQDVMDLTWELRKNFIPVRYVGDPYGDNTGGAGTGSFYEALTLRSQELCAEYPDLPPVEIAVLTKYDEGARYHPKRKEAGASMIPRIKWNNSPRVRYVVESLQNYRYKSQDEGRLVQNEPNKPAHDWSSHPSTAFEYFAIIATIDNYLAMPNLSPVIPGQSSSRR